MRMSLRATMVIAAVVGALVAPGVAGAVVLTPIATDPYLEHVAPGRNGAVWAAGDRGVFLKERDGALRNLASTPSVDTSAPLVGARDGSVWFTSRYPTVIGHLTPAGTLHLTPAPASLANATVNDIDVSPSGTVWLVLTGRIVRGTPTTASVMRIDPDGSIRTAAVATFPRPEGSALQIAAGDDDAILGLRCGTVAVRTRGSELVMDGDPPACDGESDRVVAMEYDASGSLWTVLENGRILRTSSVGTTTGTRITPSRAWPSEGPDLAFRTVSGEIRALIQRAHAVVEVRPDGQSSSHRLPSAVYYGDVAAAVTSLAADASGTLTVAGRRGLERLDLDRCGVRRVRGLAVPAASRVLRDAGCRVRIHTVRSHEDGPFRVTGQSVAGGASLPYGSTIVLDQARIARRCAADPRHSVVLTRNARWVTSREGREGQLVTVCDRASGRRWTLDDASHKDTSIAKVRLSGSWLGVLSVFDTTGYSHEGGKESTTLTRVDLRSRARQRVTYYGAVIYYGGGSDEEFSVRDFGIRFSTWSLNDHGDVAWLQKRSVRLLRHGANKPVTLDSDPTGVFAHLQVDGRRVSWTRDGVARSALI